MDGFSDRGSTPLRSIKNSLTGQSPVGLFFLYTSGHRTRKARKHVFFLTVTDRLNRKKWSSKIDEKACGNAE